MHACRSTLEDPTAFQAWFKTFLQWLRESPHGQEEARQRNNHGTWYDVQVAHFALFTGDREGARAVLEAAIEKRLAALVREDGKQPSELARTRAFNYSLMNLGALLALAELGTKLNVDFWSHPTPDHSLLRAAIDFMATYADPQQPWPYQQITPLHRGDLIPFLRQARWFTGDARYDRFLEKLPPAEVQSDRANLLWPAPAEPK